MNLIHFITDYEERVARLNDQAASGHLKAIEGCLERAKQIERQLTVSAYRLVFIGKPGSGKTTAICNFLRLTNDVAVNDTFSHFELLETGSGRTTAAEVHIRKADRTALIVHPMEITQQRVLIKEYCSYIWNQAFPNDNADPEEQEQDVSIEYERIIRNMLNFLTEDCFIDFVHETYSEADFDQFISDMIKKAALDLRTDTEFPFPNCCNAKTWLQKTFSDINKGKTNNISIPDQIDILLNPADIDFYFPNHISEIIDTRGYDGNAREDLRNYVDASDTICVILDEVKSLPGDKQRKILTEWVDKEQHDTINRLSLLIKVKDDALADVPEADDDPERGEMIKRGELKRKIASEHLNYRLENTLFIDSYEGFVYENRPLNGSNRKVKTVTFYDQASRNAHSEKIAAHFDAMIAHHREELSKEADALQKDIQKLYEMITAPTKSQLFTERLQEISTRIDTLKDTMIDDIEKEFDNCEDKFCYYFRYLVPTHWQSAKKTVRLDGYWRNANIYFEYTEYCERIVKRLLISKKEKIVEYIQLLKGCEAPSEDIEAYINSCIVTITVRYDQMLRSLKEDVNRLCKDAFPESFWLTAQNVQAGTGFYDRLMKVLFKQMIKSSLVEKTVSVCVDYISHFIEEINLALQNEQEILL